MRLGPYELQAELGRGGMAVVYRALHLPTGVVRAVKVLHAGADAEAVLRFRRECEALAKVEAPGIVRVFEAGQEAGRPWLAMPLMEGGSLAARLRPGEPWPAQAAVDLVARLAASLGRCHALGLVHRDVKPGNVLYDAPAPGGEAHLSDFGLVRDVAVSSLTESGTILGTLAYMAPEQLRGERVGAQADVFALGVVLHELLAGARPFTGTSPVAIARAHEAPRPVVPGLAAGISRVLAAALALDPARRPADGGALSLALRGAGPGASGIPRLALAALLTAAGLVAGVALAALRPTPDGSQPAQRDLATLRARADEVERTVAGVRLGGQGDAAALASARALSVEVEAVGRDSTLDSTREVLRLAEAEALLAAGDAAAASSAVAIVAHDPRAFLLRTELAARAGRLDEALQSLLAAPAGLAPAELVAARRRLRWATGAGGAPELEGGASAIRAAHWVCTGGALPDEASVGAVAMDDVLLLGCMARIAASPPQEQEGELLRLSRALMSRTGSPTPALVVRAGELRDRLELRPGPPGSDVRRWTVIALAYEVQARLDPGAPPPLLLEDTSRDVAADAGAWALALTRSGLPIDVGVSLRGAVLAKLAPASDDDWAVVVARAALAPAEHRLDSAATIAKKAREDPRLSPRARAGAHLLAGQRFSDAEDLAAAEPELRRSLTPDLRSPHDARRALASVLMRRGRLGEAIAECKRALELLEATQARESREIPWDRARRLEVDHDIVLSSLAWFVMIQGDLDRAGQLLRDLPEAARSDEALRARVGLSYLRGRPEEAAHWLDLITADPDSRRDRTELIVGELANGLRAVGRIDVSDQLRVIFPPRPPAGVR